MGINEKMTAIADAIRDKTGGEQPLTLDDMASEITSVYEAGMNALPDADVMTFPLAEIGIGRVSTDSDFYTEIARVISEYGEYAFCKPSEMSAGVNSVKKRQYEKGLEEGRVSGEAQGRQDQYNEFWDTLQNNGGITNYTRAFSNPNFNDKLFKPKYDFIASTMYQCFWDNKAITTLDVKKPDGSDFIIDGSNISTSTGFQRAFYGMEKLVSLCKIISSKEAPWTDAFKGDSKLSEVRFDGTIGTNISFASCKNLSDESVVSIKEHLFDFPNSENESEQEETRAITFHENVISKLGESGIAEFKVKGWTAGHA